MRHFSTQERQVSGSDLRRVLKQQIVGVQTIARTADARFDFLVQQVQAFDQRLGELGDALNSHADAIEDLQKLLTSLLEAVKAAQTPPDAQV